VSPMCPVQCVTYVSGRSNHLQKCEALILLRGYAVATNFVKVGFARFVNRLWPFEMWLRTELLIVRGLQIQS